MVIFKQNRCIALLVGVILVCFSAISLMNPGQVVKGNHSVQMDKLQSAGHAAASALIKSETPSSQRSNSTLKPMLYTTAANLGHTLTVKKSTEWNSLEKLKRGSIAKTSLAPVKKAVVKVPPAAQQALKKVEAKGSQTVQNINTASQQHPPAILFFSRTKLLTQEQKDQAAWSYAVSEEDLLLLQKIVMAEAEGEPYKGKVAVANVVLNRLRSANFPDTIHDVIYQKSQFSPVGNGRIKRVKPNEDTIKAVNAALSGVKEVTDDTYFFLSLKLAQDLTVHHSRKYAKTIGNHTFYK